MRRALFFALLSLPLFSQGADPLLEGWNATILSLEERVKRDPEDFIAWNLLIDRYLRRGRWTGDLGDVRRAANAAAQSLKVVPPELNIAGATGSVRVAMAQHRFKDASAAAEKLRDAQPDKVFGWQLLGDAQLELGQIDVATNCYEEMIRIGGSTALSESRMARLAQLRGELDIAATRLEAALEQAQHTEPVAPDLVGWIQLQLGELAFKRGDWDGAAARYQAALALTPDHWSVLEHLAELEGARGADADAIRLYERALAQTPRPEIWQALGDYHAFMKRAPEAKRCHERALADYLASVRCGEVHYYHHLASLYADGLNEPARAVEWARKDLALRRSVHALHALAWALYKNNEIAEAKKLIEEALRTGAKDPHLLYQAGMIRMSAGDLDGGRKALREATVLNPRHQSFHVHR